MKILRLYFIFSFIYHGLSGFAQPSASPDYFVTIAKDTVFCTDLIYFSNNKGFLYQLKYVALDGTPRRFKGKNNVPVVETFFIKGKTLDKIPYKAGTKSKLYVYSERLTDGPIRMYIDPLVPDQSVIYRFYVRLEDGTFYRADKKTEFEEIIRPHLFKCEALRKELKGTLNNEEEAVLKAINFYNQNCHQSTTND